jgi:hypothetical protein
VVFCIVAHLLVGSQAKKIIEEIELHGLKLENLLARRALGGVPEDR